MSADRHGAPVAYVLTRFPLLSESFILDEILGLEHLGLPVRVFAFRGPEPGQVPAKASGVRAPVTYLASRRVKRVPAAVRDNLAALLRSPARYFSALSTCVAEASTLRAFFGSVSFARQMRSAGVRMIYTHFIGQSAGAARALASLLSVPYGVTVHAQELFLTPARLLCPRASNAAVLVAISDFNKRLLLARCPALRPAHVSVVHCGVAPTRPTLRAPRHGSPLVLSVGRLVPIKGYDNLLEALRLLAQEGMQFRCKIVGAGPLQSSLRGRIQQLGLERSVELTGARDHHEVQGLLADADVFALACTRDRDGNMDGIPVALMEAMAAGLPVVSTRISGVPELVIPETGLLVRPDNPRELADALARLLTDPVARARLGERGRRRVLRHFSTSQHGRQMHRLLTERKAPVGTRGR